MNHFLIVWRHKSGQISIYRITLTPEPTIEELRKCAGRFIYEKDSSKLDEDEKRVSDLWEGVLRDKVEFIDEITTDTAYIEGNFEVILTGYSCSYSE